jgi:serine/threonine-protein kinase
VANLPLADAQARLLQDTLVAVPQDVPSLTVPAGTVVDTSPGPGERVERDSSVTVLVSSGPRPQTVQALAGMNLDQASGIVQALNLSVSEDVASEFTDQAADNVLRAGLIRRGTDAPEDCTNGCEAHEGDTIVFTVSRGPIPDVTGQSVDRATTALTNAGLQVNADRRTEYSDDFAKGEVMRILARDGGGNWLPGDTVTLVVSEGPQLFAVPNVVGLTRDEAAAALSEHFTVEGIVFPWNIAVNGLTEVKSQEPAANTMHVDGTTVQIEIDIRD